MALNTGTESTTTTAGAAHRPPKARRGALTLAAVVGAGIAVTAFAVTTLTGGHDDRDNPTTQPVDTTEPAFPAGSHNVPTR
jgi:hypothetical protein